ncbi:MAG: hypothetical protein U5K30_01510 [Acidimicrobiales bacterium]|nr:hypothetical protein [Acidimicrobiales bacterium]
MYQIEGKEVLFDWLEKQPDPTKREVMIEFMAKVAEKPTEVGVKVPDARKPIYVAFTPVNNWIVRYLVVDQFHVVKLGSFVQLE